MTLLTAAQTAAAVAETTAEVTTVAPDDLTDALDQPFERITEFSGFFSTLWKSFLDYLPTLLLGLVILAVGYIITKFMVMLLKKAFKKGKIEPTIGNFVFSLVKIVLYLLLVTVVLTFFGIPSESLIAVIGTAGVAIGLAMKDSLSNVAGGFIILLEKPFKIGDYIETNGESGTVERITVLYTIINTVDNRAVFIPNSSVSTAKVVNMTSNELRRVDLDFKISYNDDYGTARKLINDVILENEAVLRSPEPFVKMSAHDDSAIVITVRAWVKNADYWDVHFWLIEEVRKSFVSNGIQIPYSQLDVHIVDEKK